MKRPDKATHIPINADVHCVDGRSGTSVMVIIHPITQTVTHIVVEYQASEYLVKLGKVAASAPECIILSCTRAELKHMELFSTTHFIETDLPDVNMYSEYAVEPYVYLEHDILYEEERIPAGELVIRRGNEVHAKDGHIGTVDEFVVDRETGDITHLALREGHLWGKRDIAIPVSQIRETTPDRVLLKLTKDEIDSLPHVRVKRWWD